jgi:hypothetical protein
LQGTLGTDEALMERAAVQRTRKGWRSRATRLAPVSGGVVIGVLFGVRGISIWESGHSHVPTEALIYMGSITLVGGLVQLHPGLWRQSRDANVRALRKGWGSPPRRDSQRGRLVLAVRDRLIAREEQARDTPSYRHRMGVSGIGAGATTIIVALLR